MCVSDCKNMYSRGSEIRHFLVSLFPTPLEATLSQNKLSTDGIVKKHPRVVGPRQANTNGSITPICKGTGEFVSIHVRL